MLLALVFAGATGACNNGRSTGYIAEKPRPYETDSVATRAHRVGVVQGLYGPESVDIRRVRTRTSSL